MDDHAGDKEAVAENERRVAERRTDGRIGRKKDREREERGGREEEEVEEQSREHVTLA